MSGRTVHGAIVLLVIGNMLAMFSDVIIKWLGSDLPIFQFVFMRLLCAVLLLLPFLAMVDRKALFAGSRIHLLRAHIGMIAMVCMVIALQTLTLATANAVFYAGPVIVLVLAVVCFGERASLLSMLAVVSGFFGILVALQPVDITWQSLTALGTAFALAVNALLVRKLPPNQTPVHVLLLTQLYALPAALLLMLWEGSAWDWSLVTAAFGSSFFILAYNGTVLLAYRHVAANRVTSAEYTGLIWAVLFGWWWFSEVPDLWFFLGALLIAAPLMLLGWIERRRHLAPVSPAPS